jgi:hypothetical protein
MPCVKIILFFGSSERTLLMGLFAATIDIRVLDPKPTRAALIT